MFQRSNSRRIQCKKLQILLFQRKGLKVPSIGKRLLIKGMIAALDKSTTTRLLDLISQPPQYNKYKTLKDRLIDTFGLSKRERASRLLHFRELGDDKLSSLMDEMLALLGDHPPCFIFKQLFLERLPEDVRVQLVDAKFDNCRQLAKHADALWVSRDMGFSTNAVQRNRYSTHPRQR